MPRASPRLKATVLAPLIGRGVGTLGAVCRPRRDEEDGPETWETRSLRTQQPVPRDPVTNPSESVGLSATSECGCTIGAMKRTSSRRSGRPKARATGAEADGERESEDCVGAMTSGNGLVEPDPIEQRRSVSRTNFRREP